MYRRYTWMLSCLNGLLLCGAPAVLRRDTSLLRRTTLDDLPVNQQPVAPPAVGDGGTGRRLAQWKGGMSVEGLDPSSGKRPGRRTLMLRSIRTPLTLRWNMTRTVHPTFTMVRAGGAKVNPEGGGDGGGGDGGVELQEGGGLRAEGGMVVATKGKRRRELMPLADRPLAAQLLQRESRNIDRLKRTDLSNYPPYR